MRRSLGSLGILLSICFLAGGCGDSHDSIMQEMLSTFNEMNTVLDGVKDEATAKAAAPKVEALATKAKEIQDRGNKLGKASDADQKALREKYKQQMTDTMGKLMQNAMRIQMHPEMAQPLDAAMGKMPSSSPM